MARIKKCSKCGHQHNPPRGKHCTYMDDVEDPLPAAEDAAPRDTPPRAPTPPPSPAHAAQPPPELWETVLATLESVNKRLDNLDNRPVTPPAVPEVVTPEDRVLRDDMRARMAMLEVQQDSDSGSEDWEPAGAGAGGPRARSAGKNTAKGKTVRSKRSGAVRVATDCIIWDIDWPHYHTERGPGRAPVQYDDLTIAEFVAGYMHIVNSPKITPMVRDNMLIHLQNLMVDATRQMWHVVRHFHRTVLVHMEMGLLTWENMDIIKEMRSNVRSEAFTVHAPATGNNKKPPSGAAPRAPAAYCVPFQTNACKFQGDHGNLRHICAFCQITTGGNYPHGEFDCRRKRGTNNSAKNECCPGRLPHVRGVFRTRITFYLRIARLNWN